MDFNGTKPNRLYSSTNSVNYSMTNLIINKDVVFLSKKRFKYFQKIKISFL